MTTPIGEYLFEKNVVNRSFADVIDRKKPRLDDRVFFADEEKVHPPGDTVGYVIGISNLTIGEFINSNPNGQLKENLYVSKKVELNPVVATTELAKMIKKSYDKRGRDYDITSFIVCSLFNDHLEKLYSDLIDMGIENPESLDIIPVTGTVKMDGKRIVERIPRDYDCKQIVGSISGKHYLQSSNRHHRKG